MKKGKILVVDDNQGIRNALKILLAPHFSEIGVIASPKTLVSTMDSMKPDVVLLDMNFYTDINTGNEGLYWTTELKKMYPQVELAYFQSNVEGELIDKIHEVGFTWDGIVLNAGAYTHTSIALQDAIRGVKAPVVEVHISNVHQREDFRHQSMISCACVGVICGFGLDSYRLGIEGLLNRA